MYVGSRPSVISACQRSFSLARSVLIFPWDTPNVSSLGNSGNQGVTPSPGSRFKLSQSDLLHLNVVSMNQAWKMVEAGSSWQL